MLRPQGAGPWRGRGAARAATTSTGFDPARGVVYLAVDAAGSRANPARLKHAAAEDGSRFSLRLWLPLAAALLVCLVAGGVVWKRGGTRSRLPAQVYQNDQQGLRFQPPQGWTQIARPTNAPDGRPDEQVVVAYRRKNVLRPGSLRVTQVNAAATASTAEVLADRSPGAGWMAEGAVEDLTIGGAPAGRIAFVGQANGLDMVCEVTAVRRGNQVCYHTATVPKDDARGLEEVRRSAESLSWPASAAASRRP